MDIWHHGAPLRLPAEVKGKMNDFGSERQFITFTTENAKTVFAPPREKVGEERKCCVYIKVVTWALLLLLLLFLARWPGGKRGPAKKWPSPQMSAELMAAPILPRRRRRRRRWRRRRVIVNAHMDRRGSHQHRFHLPYGHVYHRRRRHPLSPPFPS